MRKFIILVFAIFTLNLFYINVAYAQNSDGFYLGAPYIVNPLGDGENAPYTKGPLYRFDGFDCTTYVETILAQKKGLSEQDFQKKLMLLRYMDGKINFFSRAHFMEYHWIPNAIKYQFISEYTLQNTKKSKVKLNIQTWFLENKLIKNKDEAYIAQAKKQPEIITASIPYIPSKKITKEFIRTLPELMVVFFIKEIPANSWPGQSEKQELVTHMGILSKGKLYHASVMRKKVLTIDLVDYLKEVPKFIGVSFYKVTP